MKAHTKPVPIQASRLLQGAGSHSLGSLLDRYVNPITAAQAKARKVGAVHKDIHAVTLGLDEHESSLRIDRADLADYRARR